MKYDILLTKVDGNGYVARPVQWPEVTAVGVDEAAALASVHTALAEFLAKSRIVQIELPTPEQPTEDPWACFAGMWADMPEEQWVQFQSAIADARHSIDQAQEPSHPEISA